MNLIDMCFPYSALWVGPNPPIWCSPPNVFNRAGSWISGMNFHKFQTGISHQPWNAAITAAESVAWQPVHEKCSSSPLCSRYVAMYEIPPKSVSLSVRGSNIIYARPNRFSSVHEIVKHARHGRSLTGRFPHCCSPACTPVASAQKSSHHITL